MYLRCSIFCSCLLNIIILIIDKCYIILKKLLLALLVGINLITFSVILLSLDFCKIGEEIESVFELEFCFRLDPLNLLKFKK